MLLGRNDLDPDSEEAFALDLTVMRAAKKYRQIKTERVAKNPFAAFGVMLQGLWER